MPNSDYVINTYGYTLTHDAYRCLGILAERGFDAFELMMYPGHAWPADLDGSARRNLKAFLRKRGLTLRSLNQPNIDINLAAATREMRDYSLGIVGAIVELAGDLDVPAVVVGPGKVNPLMAAPRESVVGHLYRALDVLVPLAERCGTSLLMENMPFAFLPGIGELTDVVDRYGADQIGIVYDIANGAFIGEDLPAALERCRPRLRLIHLSDTTRAVYRHDPIGEGDIDMARVAADLAAFGWRDRIVLEIIRQDGDPTASILDSIGRLDGCGWGGRFTGRSEMTGAFA